MKRILVCAPLLATLFAAAGYKVIGRIPIGGSGGWDYIAMDAVSRRLYAAHANEVDVIDPDAGKLVGKIGGLHGVHGIAIANDLNKGFITSGQSNTVTVFDLSRLAKTGEVITDAGPVAFCYEPKTRRVFSINHKSGSATAIDATTGAVLKSFPIGAAPEFCQADGAGKIYVNLEGPSELVEIDAAASAVTRRTSTRPCEGPTGLAIDVKGKKLFSVCDDVMAVTDIATFKVVGTAAIGKGPDAAGFDSALGLAFSSNGDSGTLSVVKPVDGKYQTVDTIVTENGARTMAVDEKMHRVYLLGAELGQAPAPKDGKKKSRPVALADSFHLLVLGK